VAPGNSLRHLPPTKSLPLGSPRAVVLALKLSADRKFPYDVFALVFEASTND
jgi:hypothetical protein